MTCSASTARAPSPDADPPARLVETDIRDADLLAELAKHPAGFGRDTMVRVLASRRPSAMLNVAPVQSDPHVTNAPEARALLGSEAAALPEASTSHAFGDRASRLAL